jgi:hypothetical protein
MLMECHKIILYDVNWGNMVYSQDVEEGRIVRLSIRSSYQYGINWQTIQQRFLGGFSDLGEAAACRRSSTKR